MTARVISDQDHLIIAVSYLLEAAKTLRDGAGMDLSPEIDAMRNDLYGYAGELMRAIIHIAYGADGQS